MHWEIVNQSQLGAGLGNRISGDRELAGDGGSCVVGSGLETRISREWGRSEGAA